MSYKSLLYSFAYDYIHMEESMNKEFINRAEEARKKYWDACKYPRKTKKKMRKEAIADYNFYMLLANFKIL